MNPSDLNFLHGFYEITLSKSSHIVDHEDWFSNYQSRSIWGHREKVMIPGIAMRMSWTF